MSDSVKTVKEPMFHIIKRDDLPWWAAWSIRIVAVLVALILTGVLTFIITGVNPFVFYKTMISGTFGTEKRIWITLQKSAILLCLAIGLTPAFKMRFWNIGAEGQALIGGLIAAACMQFMTGYNPVVAIFVMVVVSILGGALWALIPAVFKAFFNTNETLFTLMMNYIATQLVSYFIYKWDHSGHGNLGIINRSTRFGWFADIFGNEYILSIFIVSMVTLIMFVYLKYDKQGYEIAVVGESENTARYIGINVKKVILRTVAVSGAICGLAGLILVAGVDHTLTKDTVAGRGFTAIMVSWLAKFDPLVMVLTAFLIVFLERGGSEVASSLSVNDSFSEIVSGIIIFFIIGSEFFINYSLIFKGKDVLGFLNKRKEEE